MASNRTWTDSYQLYSNKPDFYMGYYYIHKHHKNIGRMDLQKPMSDNQMATLYRNYKYGKDATLSDTLKNQYSELIYSSIRPITDDVTKLELLNSIFNPENTSEAILNKLHKELQKGFEDQFTPNKIIQMLNIEKSTNWTISKNNKNADAVALMKMLNQGDMSEAKAGFRFLNQILQGMSEAVKLLNSPEGDKLGTILATGATRKFYDINKLGSYLRTNLVEFIKQNNGNTISAQDAVKAANLLLTVASSLESGLTSKGKKLTLGSLQGLVQKSFYSMLAEIFITNMQEAAENATVKYIVQAISDINNNAGQEEVQLEFTDPEGHYSSHDPLNGGEKKQGKADAKFENVQVSLETFTGEDNGYFTMSVGISNKAYITNHIGVGSLKKFTVYSLGGGMTIGNALTLLFGGTGHIREKYLAYNILAQGEDKLPRSLKALQDTLLTRSIIYLAGARGKTDFAQFMLLNGELLSVWDIVKFALGNDIGLSSSQQKKSNQSGIYLSIPNRKIFMKYAQSRFWARRVIKTNISIASAAMKAHIVPKQIIEYASKNMKT